MAVGQSEATISSSREAGRAGEEGEEGEEGDRGERGERGEGGGMDATRAADESPPGQRSGESGESLRASDGEKAASARSARSEAAARSEAGSSGTLVATSAQRGPSGASLGEAASKRDLPLGDSSGKEAAEARFEEQPPNASAEEGQGKSLEEMMAERGIVSRRAE